MEKRAERLKKVRINKKKKAFDRAASVTARLTMCSLLITAATYTTGQTYGMYKDVEKVSDRISACPVFPKTIEQRFSELKKQLSTFHKQEEALMLLTVPSLPNSSIKKPDQPTIEKLEALKERIGKTEREYKGFLDTLEMYMNKLQKLHGEINISAEEVRGTSKKLNSYLAYDQKCLDIGKYDISQISKTLNQLHFLDPQLATTINHVITSYGGESGIQYESDLAESGIETSLTKWKQSKMEEVSLLQDKTKVEVSALNNLQQEVNEEIKILKERQAKEKKEKELEQERKAKESEEQLESQKTEDETTKTKSPQTVSGDEKSSEQASTESGNKTDGDQTTPQNTKTPAQGNIGTQPDKGSKQNTDQKKATTNPADSNGNTEADKIENEAIKEETDNNENPE